MKQIIKTMIVVLAGLSTLACNKVQEQAPAEDKAPASDEFTYTIAVDGETKAYLNSDHMTWQSGDVIGCLQIRLAIQKLT